MCLEPGWLYQFFTGTRRRPMSARIASPEALFAAMVARSARRGRHHTPKREAAGMSCAGGPGRGIWPGRGPGLSSVTRAVSLDRALPQLRRDAAACLFRSPRGASYTPAEGAQIVEFKEPDRGLLPRGSAIPLPPRLGEPNPRLTYNRLEGENCKVDGPR
jgi:hypothetical protein